MAMPSSRAGDAQPVVEAPCGDAVHRLAVHRGEVVPLDHDLEDERALFALGGTASECVAVASAVAAVDSRMLLTVGWDSSPALARHLPPHEVERPSPGDWVVNARHLGRIPDNMTAEELAQRLAVVRAPSPERDAWIVALTEAWWGEARNTISRTTLSSVVVPRFGHALERSLQETPFAAMADPAIRVGLTDGGASVVTARLRSGRLEVEAYVAYSWLADVWAAGIDSAPGYMPLTPASGVRWETVRFRRWRAVRVS